MSKTIAEVHDLSELTLRLLDLFSPVIGPSRTREELVRFGLGAYDLPGFPYTQWAAMRGLVFALQTEAELAWNEAVALAGELLEIAAQLDPPDEAIRTRDPALLKRAKELLEDPSPSAKAEGLKLHAKALVSTGEVDNSPPEWFVQKFNEWRIRWNLADDRSPFTMVVSMAALNATDVGQQLPADFRAAANCLFLMQSDWGIDPVAIAASEPPPRALTTREEALSRSLETLSFDFPGFVPFFEDEATYKAAAREEFANVLDWHIKAHKAVMEAGGAPRTPVKRAPDAHFQWYIRYQVLRESYATIVERILATPGAQHVSASTVRSGINSVVKMTGVPKRLPGTPGPKTRKPTVTP